MNKNGIREAIAGDVPALVEAGSRFHASTVYSSLIPYSPDSVEQMGLQLVAGPDSTIWVCEIDSQLVGMLGLAIFDHPITGIRTAGELFWWVDPLHRGSLGVRLLRAAERWATNKGAKILNMIAPTQEVERLYSVLRYTKVEVNYQKVLVGEIK